MTRSKVSCAPYGVAEGVHSRILNWFRKWLPERRTSKKVKGHVLKDVKTYDNVSPEAFWLLGVPIEVVPVEPLEQGIELSAGFEGRARSLRPKVYRLGRKPMWGAPLAQKSELTFSPKENSKSSIWQACDEGLDEFKDQSCKKRRQVQRKELIRQLGNPFFLVTWLILPEGQAKIKD